MMKELAAEEVLFTIKRENLETGLRGFPVGYCVTSSVEAERGLCYAGIPIAQLASGSCEEAIYLLMHGKRGNESEVKELTQQLRKRAQLDQELVNYIQALPRKMAPMSMLSAALLIADHFSSRGDYLEDALNLIAKIPHLVATVINHHGGWKTKKSEVEGYMANFVAMLGAPNLSEQLAEACRLINILQYDHGGGNLSTFVGKAVASSLANQYASNAAGILALGGPLHGGACEEALKMVQAMNAALGAEPSREAIAQFIEKKLEKREVIYGFGHAVLRIEDPRAALLYDFGRRHYKDHPLVALALELREIVPSVLKGNPRVQNPYANIDAITGPILVAAGFNYPEYFPVLFGLARTVGISLQIVYERLQARQGKGTPLVRPKYLYRDLKR